MEKLSINSELFKRMQEQFDTELSSIVQLYEQSHTVGPPYKNNIKKYTTFQTTFMVVRRLIKKL